MEGRLRMCLRHALLPPLCGHRRQWCVSPYLRNRIL